MHYNFHSIKMRWLNGVFYNASLPASACRIAYLIADCTNHVTWDSWLSHLTISRKLKLSTKTVQRGVRALKNVGQLTIRFAGPDGVKPRLAPTLSRLADDILGPGGGQFRPRNPDRSVHQSYSSNLPISDLSGQRRPSQTGHPIPSSIRGKYEIEVAGRLGFEGFDVLAKLASIDDAIVARLCDAQARGLLTDTDLRSARLAARHVR